MLIVDRCKRGTPRLNLVDPYVAGVRKQRSSNPRI